VEAPPRWVRTATLISLLASILLAGGAFGQIPRPFFTPTSSSSSYSAVTASRKDSLSSTIRLPSESKALYLSLATTLVPVAIGAQLALTKDANPAPGAVIIGTALILGPSTGYFYGGCTDRGLQGIQIRMLTGGAAILLGRLSSGKQHDFTNSIDALAVACAVGGGMVAIEALYDLARVKSIVAEHNSKRAGTSLSLGSEISAGGNFLALKLRAAF